MVYKGRFFISFTFFNIKRLFGGLFELFVWKRFDPSLL